MKITITKKQEIINDVAQKVRCVLFIYEENLGCIIEQSFSVEELEALRDEILKVVPLK